MKQLSFMLYALFLSNLNFLPKVYGNNFGCELAYCWVKKELFIQCTNKQCIYNTYTIQVVRHFTRDIKEYTFCMNVMHWYSLYSSHFIPFYAHNFRVILQRSMHTKIICMYCVHYSFYSFWHKYVFFFNWCSNSNLSGTDLKEI